MRKITKEFAEKIYLILIEMCGAPNGADDKMMFIYEAEEGFSEHRCCHSLGFGGKFHNDGTRWRVGCYPEHQTKEIMEIIKETNIKLDSLFQDYQESKK